MSGLYIDKKKKKNRKDIVVPSLTMSEFGNLFAQLSQLYDQHTRLMISSLSEPLKSCRNIQKRHTVLIAPINNVHDNVKYD